MVLFALFCLFGDLISLKDSELDVEIANTPEKRANGLMGRLELEEGAGMLFIYDTPQILTFWMKNTLLPLSIAFFDSEKTLINMLDMEPPFDEQYTYYKSKKAALYALEVPQGWFKKQGIRPGDKFTFLDQNNRIE